MALPCILFVILLNSLRVNSQHNLSSQQAVLLSFQRHWGYSFSPYSLQWNSSSSPCDWPYVSCTGDMVTGLSLSHRGIFGTFPSSSICQLKNLVSLDMSNNYIQGPIPAGLRKCSSLQILDLSSNVISGTIPGEIFLMESLVTLSLGKNNLSGIVPNTIQNASSLERLDLSNNYLTGSIPDGFRYIYNLWYLDLSVNSFSGGIPSELFLVKNLRSLFLGGNRLVVTIPTTIENASSLEILDLSNNYLNGSIFDGFRYLYNLSDLDLSVNSFSSGIPSELFLMKNLRSLSLGGNRLFGTIPTTIENASSLEILDLSNNYLNGSIPDGFRYLYNLSDLDLSVNSFTGEIPCELFLMESLVTLSLSQNILRGIIPATIENASRLESLDLSNNYLSGSIPDGFRYLYNLSYLDLSVNSFSGGIPSELFLVKNLRSLSLGGNRLFGTIPTTVEKAISLERLYLSNNNLNGSIPDGITRLRNLKILRLSLNSFSGGIPSELFLMESLFALYLDGNNLSGIVPTTIQNASILGYLNLSNNTLNGSIPDGITYLHNLRRLDLSMNSFSGEIPGELFLMENLARLYLNGNRLFGIIPTTIEKAVRLESLDLSNNYLNGSIPDGITYLYNLINLDLSVNSFSGEIPSGLFSIRGLQSLSLGYNNLSGQLHSYIDLEFLNLTHNRLSGPILGSFEIADISPYLRWAAVLDLCNNKFSGTLPHEFIVNSYFPNNYCLDPWNLCSANGTDETLPSCPSTLCSYDTFRGYGMCDGYTINEKSHSYKHKKSQSYRITIIVLGIAAGYGLVFAALYYLTRKCKKVLESDPSVKEEEAEWKMISFQGLNFETTDILSSLTDENLIGNGGSGKVYRVFTNETRSCVAVKSIYMSSITDHRAEKEFLAEIHTLGAVWHYNIIKLLCYISGPDVKLLVYEYFENKSLDRWLHGATKLDWPTRMNIAIGAAQGLCYMHHHCPIPIIHRDIKSSNILLDSEFNAKIADFGLAKLLNTRGDTETASAVAGTFGYIAPEYAYTSKVNAKSDVYSFGVVLLELTTGRKAVTRGDHLNLGGWAHLQCKDASSTFDALDGEIKEASIYLDQIISVFRLGVVCTAALPSNRPSMKDCLDILQNCTNIFSKHILSMML